MKLKIVVIAICSMFMFALPSAVACTGDGHSIPSSISNQPIEIVSLTGFMNPGPNVELVVKNISTGPIYHMVLYLDLGMKTPPGQMVFDSGFTQENTLAQGATTSLTAIVSTGTFRADATYVLSMDVSVLVQGGASTYNYQIKVKMAENTSERPLSVPIS